MQAGMGRRCLLRARFDETGASHRRRQGGRQAQVAVEGRGGWLDRLAVGVHPHHAVAGADLGHALHDEGRRGQGDTPAERQPQQYPAPQGLGGDGEAGHAETIDSITFILSECIGEIDIDQMALLGFGGLRSGAGTSRKWV